MALIVYHMCMQNISFEGEGWKMDITCSIHVHGRPKHELPLWKKAINNTIKYPSIGDSAIAPKKNKKKQIGNKLHLGSRMFQANTVVFSFGTCMSVIVKN